jgi:hypothetical protein
MSFTSAFFIPTLTNGKYERPDLQLMVNLEWALCRRSIKFDTRIDILIAPQNTA